MKNGNRAFCFLAVFLCAVFVLSAQNFPSLEVSPAARVFAEKLARPSASYWRDLAEAALWASAVNGGAGAEEKAAAYLDRLNAAAAELASVDLPRSLKERGEYVLTFVHKKFLKSYSEYQTRLDEIFISGRYNCVSSAVLYMVLGMSSGLEIGGVMTKDHAFAALRAGGETIDVETTNPYGFDPGNRKEFQDAFGKSTGYAYVPAKNYRDRAAINPPELVSLILSNRIAVLEKANRFAEAVPLALNRAVFLGGNTGVSGARDRAEFIEDPHRDMMTRLFNYGAWLVKGGKDDDALAWARYAGGRFADEGWQEFILAAVHNKAVRLIRSRRTVEARTALDAEKDILGAEQYRALDAMVSEAEFASALNGARSVSDAESVLARIDEAWNRLPPERRDELRTAAVLKKLELLGKTGDWRESLAWINAALEKYGKNSQLDNAQRMARQNRISELHNGFASLYNRREYQAAKAFIEKALQEFPGERQLAQDRSLAEEALKKQ